MAMNTQNHRRDRKGAVTVEAAILFPMLLLLALGIIEYGWAFLKAHEISNAARNGARVAARPYATNSEVQQAVGSMLTNAGIASYTLTLTPNDVSSAPRASLVRVGIVVNYDTLRLGDKAPLLPGPAQLSSSVSMAKEGP